MLPSAAVFVSLGWLKCSNSTTCFFRCSKVIKFSHANLSPKRSVNSRETGKNSSWVRFSWLFRRHILKCNSYGWTELFWITVFRSTIKFNSALLKFSSHSAFSIFGFWTLWVIWFVAKPFQQCHSLLGQCLAKFRLVASCRCFQC